jgi:hypothetical protein
MQQFIYNKDMIRGVHKINYDMLFNCVHSKENIDQLDKYLQKSTNILNIINWTKIRYLEQDMLHDSFYETWKDNEIQCVSADEFVIEENNLLKEMICDNIKITIRNIHSINSILQKLYDDNQRLDNKMIETIKHCHEYLTNVVNSDFWKLPYKINNEYLDGINNIIINNKQ